jgi:hypothetical protein
MLEVYKDEIEGHTEYNFNIVPEKVDVSNNGTENSRRSRARGVKCYVNLLVNDKKIATSKKVNMTWPKYEINFVEKF